MFAGLGYLPNQNVAADPNALPVVGDPEKAFADMTRTDYLDYVKNYRDFELELIDKSKSDTTLIDQAREDVGQAKTLASGMAERNASRYGASLTPAQIQAQQRGLEQQSTLGGVQAINDARKDQNALNYKLQSQLINIGQGISNSAQASLGSAARDAAARNQAYKQAQAQSKANTFSTIGGLGALAILAF